MSAKFEVVSVPVLVARNGIKCGRCCLCGSTTEYGAALLANVDVGYQTRVETLREWCAQHRPGNAPAPDPGQDQQDIVNALSPMSEPVLRAVTAALAE